MMNFARSVRLILNSLPRPVFTILTSALNVASRSWSRVPGLKVAGLSVCPAQVANWDLPKVYTIKTFTNEKYRNNGIKRLISART
jgi:hypothetical protein